MMPTQETVAAVNTAGEFGTYIPGRRMEVEQGPWDIEAVSGWGPGSPDRDGWWYVVQRDDHSPHPITWHSTSYPTREEARCQSLRREILREKKDLGEDWRLTVPVVAHLAFKNHWSVLAGCHQEGQKTPTLARCETRQCVDDAVRDICAAIDQGDLIRKLLTYGEYV